MVSILCPNYDIFFLNDKEHKLQRYPSETRVNTKDNEHHYFVIFNK